MSNDMGYYWGKKDVEEVLEELKAAKGVTKSIDKLIVNKDPVIPGSFQ